MSKGRVVRARSRPEGKRRVTPRCWGAGSTERRGATGRARRAPPAERGRVANAPSSRRSRWRVNPGRGRRRRPRVSRSDTATAGGARGTAPTAMVSPNLDRRARLRDSESTTLRCRGELLGFSSRLDNRLPAHANARGRRRRHARERSLRGDGEVRDTPRERSNERARAASASPTSRRHRYSSPDSLSSINGRVVVVVARSPPPQSSRARSSPRFPHVFPPPRLFAASHPRLQ